MSGKKSSKASPEKEEKGSSKEETDTQKLANDMGLKDEQPVEDKLDFYSGADKEPEQMIDVEDDAMVLNNENLQGEEEKLIEREEAELDKMIHEQDKKKEKELKPEPIDVFNDPLLPEDMDPR